MPKKKIESTSDLYIYIYEMGKRSGYFDGVIDTSKLVPIHSLSNKEFNLFLKQRTELLNKNKSFFK